MLSYELLKVMRPGRVGWEEGRKIMGASGPALNRKSYFTLFQLYLVDLEADCSVPGGPLGLNGESRRWIFELHPEHGVGPGVRVLDLHVQVGQGGAVGHVFRDGHLVVGLD